MSDFITLKLPDSEKAAFSEWIYSQKSETVADVRKLVKKTLEDISRRTKQFAPVDHGYLRSSVRVVNSHNELGGSVFVGRHYSPYVEFGTGTKVVAPADVSEYAMTFKGRGVRKVNLRAQPYFFPAVRISQKEMMARLEQMGFKKK